MTNPLLPTQIEFFRAQAYSDDGYRCKQSRKPAGSITRAFPSPSRCASCAACKWRANRLKLKEIRKKRRKPRPAAF
jgi:hypothetical protein